MVEIHIFTFHAFMGNLEISENLKYCFTWLEKSFFNKSISVVNNFFILIKIFLDTNVIYVYMLIVSALYGARSRISLIKAHVLWWCDNKSDLIWFILNVFEILTW